jgi:NAD(P)-dependent dehydrogenase (short-subunit alcohol dehydrogenase family)
MNDDKIAIVTGGNRGIGLEICRQLARAHVHVVLASRDPEAGERAAAQIAQDAGRVEARALDVTAESSVAAMASWIDERFGRLDILVNNAGILIDRVPTALDLDADMLHKLLDTNLAGPLRVTRALAPLLRRSRHPRIVNVSTALAQISFPGTDRPGYRISKMALNALTRMLAADLQADGIKVNAMSPGWVRTRMGGAEAPRSAEQGADTAAWLALIPDDGPSGGFFMDRKPIPW